MVDEEVIVDRPIVVVEPVEGRTGALALFVTAVVVVFFVVAFVFWQTDRNDGSPPAPTVVTTPTTVFVPQP